MLVRRKALVPILFLRGALVPAQELGTSTCSRGRSLEVRKEVWTALRLELLSGVVADADSVLWAAGAGNLEDLRAVRLGDKPTEDKLAVDNARLAGDWRLAVAIEGRQERALAVDRDLGRLVAQRVDVLQRALIILAALDADRALRDGRQHLVPLDDGGEVLLHVHTLQARVRQQRRIHHALVQLAQASLHVAPEVDHLQRRVFGKDLRLPPERGAADHGAVGKVSDRLGLRRNEYVAGVLTLQVARQHRPLGDPGRHVLHRVHADVHLVGEQSNIKLLREEALAANLGEGLVQDHVTSRLHRDDLDRTLLSELGERRLE
mmetsp:Transcript_25018/g.64579  ORF Transcript_25018/g.64579 Transcript_25018/m.64579 type:complete len:320 (-) Transcript_25018:253-1212(-)